MSSADNKLKSVVFKLNSLLLILLIFLSAFPAYALDNNYVISEYNGWIDVDDRIDYEKSRSGFDGFLKRIVDEENGCFYIYFSFYDVRLNEFDDENIVISFNVWNDVNSYNFSVNKNGFVNTGADEQNNIRIAYNFNNCSINGRGGEIFIGFELLNKTDRVLYNQIRCEYAGGINHTALLFNNQSLDMYVEPSVKESTTTVIKSTKETKSTTVKNTSSAKTTKGSTEANSKTTKYTPTGTVKSNVSQVQSANFSGSSVYLPGSITDDFESEDITAADYAESAIGNYRMSKTAVVVMTIAVVMVVVGIVLVVIGFAVKNNSNKANDVFAIDKE